YQSGAVDSLQGKQNISDESTNGNLNSNTEQMVDTPKKDDEKQGDSPQEGEQRVDTPRRDSEHRLDTPETTIKLEEQLEEIKLD
ncbi:Os01g0835000, partial [Oryza sativa Japonica Group]